MYTHTHTHTPLDSSPGPIKSTLLEQEPSSGHYKAVQVGPAGSWAVGQDSGAHWPLAVYRGVRIDRGGD